MPKQIEQSRSQLASLVLNSTMKKCQEFIDKVSELRFIKIKERQVNKFNKLIKKQGNITWFSAVPSVGNPWANNSSGECPDAQAASDSPPASPVRSQAPQTENTDAQAVSTSPPGCAQVPQAGADIQTISTPSLASPVRLQAPQVETTDAQAVSTSPPHSAQVPQAGADTQAISAPSPASRVRSQATQTENTDAQAVSKSPPASNQASSDAQASSAVPQSSNDNSLQDPNPKWVINSSSKPLTQAQMSVLAKALTLQ